jgi:hypothetical protein
MNKKIPVSRTAAYRQKKKKPLLTAIRYRESDYMMEITHRNISLICIIRIYNLLPSTSVVPKQCVGRDHEVCREIKKDIFKFKIDDDY